MNQQIRHDWQLPEVEAIFQGPLLDLVYQAATIHRAHHDSNEMQKCTLVSIKTGGCPEDCSYCSQSAHFKTSTERAELMSLKEVTAIAKRAKEAGASRLCMGAAWRSPKPGKNFDRVLDMVKAVNAEGLESCVTLGMLTREQAQQLGDVGLTAYNHNLDTSRAFYPNIISTRNYKDRLETLNYVREAGVGICCGGILGLGESRQDRCALLQTLANFEPHPESVPINLLVPIDGTPLQSQTPIDPFELVRTTATARILMPLSRVRLSAGRKSLSKEIQTLCFLAGANSIFFGEELLTTENRGEEADTALLAELGL